MRPYVLSNAEDFAVRIVKVYQYLKTECKEKRISDQLYRSGTAIQALIAEAEFAQSRADFVNKMQIALKEANETKHWITLLFRSNYFNERMYDSLMNDLNPIIYMLISIVKTTKENGL